MAILGKIDISISFKSSRILKGSSIYIISDVFTLANCKNDGFVNDSFASIAISQSKFNKRIVSRSLMSDVDHLSFIRFGLVSNNVSI